jgi:glycosyltransferase involved in cell wall biosynthesis
VRIAMLAPLYEAVPPRQYGGTERVIYYLTEELVRRGHDVTLFAAGGSRTSARLVEVCPRPLNGSARPVDPLAAHVLQLGLAYDQGAEFDLIHSHCDFRAFPFARLTGFPTVSTNHNRLDTPENLALARCYPESPITALSASHQRQLPYANWLGVCYNGVPVEQFPFAEQAGDYLAFAGRLSPEKGPLEAIEVAERTGIPLRIAAKVNEWERDYFERQIRPHLSSPLVEYVGELGEDDKRSFLAGALALLFPISWAEPFGMVMVEAMAAGTPVLAYPAGAVPEIVDDGATGYVCPDLATMVARIPDVLRLDRARCRQHAAQRFSAGAMADAYERMYQCLLARFRPIPFDGEALVIRSSNHASEQYSFR